MKKMTAYILALSLLTISAFAADNKKEENKQTEKKQNSPVLVFNNLELSAAYWQEAWSKGNSKQADIRESEVEKIIWDDLFKSMRKESTVETEDQTRDSLLKVKHRLFKSFKKGETFGHKFRIVSDYKDVLKQQIELDKKELVEKDKDSKK